MPRVWLERKAVKDVPNGRTHEPSLRELTAQLDDVKELMAVQFQALREVMSERDRRYDAQFKSAETAVSAALAAAEKQTTAAFSSSEKAIVKAEDAQKEYNLRSNEFRAQLKDQADRLITKDEANNRFKVQDEKIEVQRTDIASLRESRSAGTGREAQTQSSQASLHLIFGAVGMLIAIALFAMAAYTFLRPVLTK